MKKLTVIAITLTAIGVAVKVGRSKRNDTNKKLVQSSSDLLFHIQTG